MNTKLRSFLKALWSEWSTERKNVDAVVTELDTSHKTKISGRLGRRGRYLRAIGTPPVCRLARIVRGTSTWAWRLRPLSSWP